MSSNAFQPYSADGNYRRLEPGWRRMRIDGHLYEAPVEQRGHQQVTLHGSAVHVADCPTCITGP